MRFLKPLPDYDLTYNDVFLVPNYSEVESRFAADITPPDGIGTTIPVIAANMNAVSGKRMAETIARRGGLAILPQDIPFDVLAEMVEYIKTRHHIFETPLTLQPENSIAEALNIIHKRSHQAIVVTNDKQQPVGIFTESDAIGRDKFSPVGQAMNADVVVLSSDMDVTAMFEVLHKQRLNMAPVLKNKKLAGVMTQKGALRSSLYRPAVNAKGQLLTGVAIGVNGNVAAKAEAVIAMGVDVIVIDTAHGHQKKMIDALKAVRKVDKKIPLVAGNVVTAKGVVELIEAGADIIKVGVGPGAMCTTRMMTGVGRPQFSAVLECAAAAKKLGKYIWADGGIKYPRDAALALAAGASCGFIGTWFAGTYESAGDTLRDNQGKLYKENFGMASKRAVRSRIASESSFEMAKRELFEEGASQSRMYIQPELPGVEDIIDSITAGLRSSMTYAGARNIKEFQKNAVIGVQSASGYQEGKAVETNWS